MCWFFRDFRRDFCCYFELWCSFNKWREAQHTPRSCVRQIHVAIRIHGDAPMDLSMPFPVPLDDLASYVPAFNANGPVNAIPYVCAAAPGLLTTEDLPHILPRGPR